MAVSKIRRGTAAQQAGWPVANSIRVDSTTNLLTVGSGASGSTEKTYVDTASAQTLTNKTISPLYPETIIAGDGAITIASGGVLLTKGSAAAITLAAPTAAQVGTNIVIMAGSAFAHVVTATGLIDDGVTGGSKTTATFGAFVGSSLALRATSLLKWTVVSKNVVTIT